MEGYVQAAGTSRPTHPDFLICESDDSAGITADLRMSFITGVEMGRIPIFLHPVASPSMLKGLNDPNMCWLSLIEQLISPT